MKMKIFTESFPSKVTVMELEYMTTLVFIGIQQFKIMNGHKIELFLCLWKTTGVFHPKPETSVKHVTFSLTMILKKCLERSED